MTQFPEVTQARETMRPDEARRLYLVRVWRVLDAHERRMVMYWVRRRDAAYAGAEFHAVGYGVGFSLGRWWRLQRREIVRWLWVRVHDEV